MNVFKKQVSKRQFLKYGSLSTLASFLPAFVPTIVQAKTYLTITQAQQILLPKQALTPNPIELTKPQKKAIRKASKTRVWSNKLQAWKSEKNDWFIVDQVIGKHENIDIAVAIDNQGGVIGIEILTYRESYGHQIRNIKWRAQFLGKDHSEHLKLDQQINNISGATLSCRHITDGINRLTQTWHLVLQHLT